MLALVIAILVLLVLQTALQLFHYLELRDFVRLEMSRGAVQYQSVAESIKAPKATGKPRVVTTEGREIKATDELVDLADLDPEVGIKAIEDYGS